VIRITDKQSSIVYTLLLVPLKKAKPSRGGDAKLRASVEGDCRAARGGKREASRCEPGWLWQLEKIYIRTSGSLDPSLLILLVQER